jgi:hypothetical protein
MMAKKAVGLHAQLAAARRDRLRCIEALQRTVRHSTPSHTALTAVLDEAARGCAVARLSSVLLH